MARKVLDGSAYTNVALGSSSTVPEYAPGDTVRCDSGLYVYGSANGAITVGQACKFVEGVYDFDTVTTAESGSTNTQLGICIAADGLADNYWGWFWRGMGTEEALLATTISADAQLTTTTTPGTLGSGGDNVDGAFAVDASGSGGVVTIRAAGLLQTNMTVAAT